MCARRSSRGEAPCRRRPTAGTMTGLRTRRDLAGAAAVAGSGIAADAVTSEAIRRLVAALPQPFREADRAAGHQQSVLSRDRRSGRRSPRHGDVAARPRPRPCCARLGAAKKDRRHELRRIRSAYPCADRRRARRRPRARGRSACGDVPALRGQARGFRVRAAMPSPAAKAPPPPAPPRAAASPPRRRAPAARARAAGRAARALRGFALGTAVSAAVAASVVIIVVRTERGQRIAGEIVSAHLRSLQGGHLTDVRNERPAHGQALVQRQARRWRRRWST